MKTNYLTNNRFSAFANESNHYVHGQDPFSFMVAPVDDRNTCSFTTPVNASSQAYASSDYHHPPPRPFKAMKMNPFNVHHGDDEFHHEPHANAAYNQRMHDDRMHAHANQFEKHPGVYTKHPSFASSKNHNHQTSKTHSREMSNPRRLIYPADQSVPQVAAQHYHQRDSNYMNDDTTMNSRSFFSPTPSSTNQRSFPFNNRDKNPIARHPTFKKDVWHNFDSRGRAAYHQRLNDSHNTINHHVQSRPHQMANMANMNTPQRPKPLVANNANSTNRNNCAHPRSPHISMREQDLTFSINKHFPANTNNVSLVIPRPNRYTKTDHNVSLSNLVTYLKTVDIILLQDPTGQHDGQHNSLIQRFFYHKSIALLPAIVKRDHQSIEFVLDQYFRNTTHGTSVYSNNRLQATPTTTSTA